jgi:hypothetical protein
MTGPPLAEAPVQSFTIAEVTDTLAQAAVDHEGVSVAVLEAALSVVLAIATWQAADLEAAE